jgi:hypothetical protein
MSGFDAFVKIASGIVSPMLYILKSWIFWAMIGTIILGTFIWFILIPFAKWALFNLGQIIGRLLYG